MKKTRFDPSLSSKGARQFVVMMGVSLPPENTLVWQEVASEDSKAAANREMDRVMLERSDAPAYPNAYEKRKAIENYDGPALIVIERNERVIRSAGYILEYDD